MKKYVKFILLSMGVVAFMASCQCKNCKKDGQLTYNLCKDGGSQQDYDNDVAFLENSGWTCH
jgi:hypothetical protein